MLTMLKITRWSAFTLSTVKLNHIRSRGLQVSGLMNRSYSNSEIRSTLPKLPVSNEASKQMCPFFAFPLWPGGRIIILFTLPNPPSASLSSLSAQWYILFEFPVYERFSKNKRITSGYDIKRNESIHIKYKWKRKGKKQSDQLFDKG